MALLFMSLAVFLFKATAEQVRWPEHVLCNSPNFQLSYVSCGEQKSSFLVCYDFRATRSSYKTEHFTRVKCRLCARDLCNLSSAIRCSEQRYKKKMYVVCLLSAVHSLV